MKHRIKYFLPLITIAFVLYGCTNKKHEHFFGSWILEGKGNTSKEIQGFTLGKSGLASTINNPRYHYEKWKLKNECLIIEGKLITDSCFVPLSDTLYIKYIDKNRLTLLHKEKKYHYIKEQ